jgi:hypothetical protein
MFSGKDMDDCDLTAVYHFTSGGYMSKRVDGLTVVLVYEPANAKTCCGKGRGNRAMKAAFYLPKDATEAQRKDLRDILTEQLMSFALLKVETHVEPISFARTKTGYRVEIPGVLTAETHAILGDSNRQMSVDNVPFVEGTRWYLGRTSQHTYRDPKDPTWNWSYPRRNGAWCKFSWDPVFRG